MDVSFLSGMIGTCSEGWEKNGQSRESSNRQAGNSSSRPNGGVQPRAVGQRVLVTGGGATLAIGRLVWASLGPGRWC